MPNTKKEVAERLREVLRTELEKIPDDIEGGKQRALAEKIELSQGYVSDILAGKKDGLRSLFDILDHLCIDIETVFSRNVGMPPANSHSSPREYGPIPLIDWKTINSNTLPIKGDVVYARVPVSEETFALTVTDDSMSPRYLPENKEKGKPADKIIVDPAVSVKSGDHVVIRVRGEYLLREVYFEDDGSYHIVTTNDEWPNYHVPASKSVKIEVIGRVVDIDPGVQ